MACEVGFYEECVGGLPGLHDLSGNVAEWEDACTYYYNTDPVQNRLVRGGTWYNSYRDNPSTLDCAAYRDLKRCGIGDSLGVGSTS